MGAFGGFLLTNKGRNLQAKAQAGTALKYTRAAIGDGTLTGQSIITMTALISAKKTLPITKVRLIPPDKAAVGTTITNQDITTGFYFREIGIFAQDPDEGEILYAYANAGANAEYLPPAGGPDIVEKEINMIVAVGRAAQVTATIDQSLVYATIKDVAEAIGAIKIEMVDSFTSTDKDKAPTADALRRGLDMKAFRRIPGIYNITGADNQDDAPGLTQYILDQHAAGYPVVPIPRPKVNYRLDTPLVFEAKHGLVLVGVGFASFFRATFVEDSKNAFRGKIIQFIDSNNVGAEMIRVEGPTGARVGGSDAIFFQRCTGFHLDHVFVTGAAATAVFCDDSHQGTITRSSFQNTEADGVHITELSSGIDVGHNFFNNTGDDSIAVVSYKRHGARCFDVNIHHNQIKKSRARAITSIGSMHVDINHNIIDGTSSCGILVHRDANPTYDTFAPIDVTISGNKVRAAGMHGTAKGTQNGIEVGEASGVKITDNMVEMSTQNGIVVLDAASRVFVDNNQSDNNAGAGFALSGKYVSGGKNTASGNGGQGAALLRLDKTSDLGDWNVVDNCSLNATDTDKSRDNFYAEASDGVRIGDVISLDNRSQQLIERAIQFHNCPNIKIGTFTINKGTKLVFSGSTAAVEAAPYVTDVVPTAASHAGYKIGQVLMFGAKSYRWDGSTWTAIADVSDVAAAQNAAATALTTHAGDASKHSYWGGTTTGDGTNVTNPAYMATVPGVQTTGALPDGFAVTVVLNVANGGADPFLRINNCTNYPIRRNATTPFAGGTLKAGQLISLVKVGNYFLARSAAPTGDASPATVLNGNTFMSAAYPDGATGTVPVLTGIRNATGAAQWGDGGIAVYPERGYQKGGAGDGEIKVAQAQLIQAEPDLVAGNIREGVNMFGVVGTVTQRRYFAQRYNAGPYSVNEVNFGFVPRSITISVLPPGGTWRIYQIVNSGVVNQDQAQYTQFSGFVLCKSGTYNQFIINEGLPQALRVYANSGSTYDTMIEAFG